MIERGQWTSAKATHRGGARSLDVALRSGVSVCAMTLRRASLLAFVLLAACSPSTVTDGGADSAALVMDAAVGMDVTQSRPDVAPIDTGILDVRENDGAMSAMTSRDCVRPSADAWSVTAHVDVTRPDGRCPDRVRITANGSLPNVCGTIEACCDYFAECLFEVELDVVHAIANRQCPRSDRRRLLGCRCINNRVECDPQRQLCPETLPEGYTCNARAGVDVFHTPLCSDCAAASDAAASDSAARD